MSRVSGVWIPVGIGILCGSIVAVAAPDRLRHVKAGQARETRMNELSQVMDGFQASAAPELQRYCASLKKERELAEREFDERARASREAEGSLGPSRGTGQVGARSAGENMAAKNALAEAMVRRTTLACHLFVVGEIQRGRSRRNIPRTKDLLARCLDRQKMPDLKHVECESEDGPKATPRTK